MDHSSDLMDTQQAESAPAILSVYLSSRLVSCISFFSYSLILAGRSLSSTTTTTTTTTIRFANSETLAYKPFYQLISLLFLILPT